MADELDNDTGTMVAEAPSTDTPKPWERYATSRPKPWERYQSAGQTEKVAPPSQPLTIKPPVGFRSWQEYDQASREYTESLKSTDFLRAMSEGGSPVAFAKHMVTLPFVAAGGALTGAGKLAYAGAADAVSKLFNDPEYGGNLASLQSGDDSLPAERFVRKAAETNPKLATTAVLGEKAAEIAPSLGVSFGSAAANRLAAAGFSAQMISQAPETFRQYAEEINKPMEQQDAGKIADLKADVISKFIFAPLLGAGAARRMPAVESRLAADVAGSGAPATGQALQKTLNIEPVMGKELPVPDWAAKRPGVPEIKPEDVVDRRPDYIREQGATTKEGVQQLFAQRGIKMSREEAGQLLSKAYPKALPAEAPPKITAAAYMDASGKVTTGANHPEILDGLGIKGFETRESRNTPQFGYVTDKGQFVTRGEAAPIIEKSGQKLEEFETPGQPHSDEIEHPTKPGKPLSAGPVPAGSVGPGAASPRDPAFTLKEVEQSAKQMAAAPSTKTAPVAEPPKVTTENGTASPAPAGSAMAPNTPPGSNQHAVYANRLMNTFSQWWEKFWPRDLSVLKVAPDSPVITAHQRLIQSAVDHMRNFADQPWWQTVKKYDQNDLVDIEAKAVDDYSTLVGKGEAPMVAYRKALEGLPEDVRAMMRFRDSRLKAEIAAADELGVDRPGLVQGPYLPRLTNEEGKNIVDLHPTIGNLGRQIRQSIGSFDNSRKYSTMKEGIGKGVQYEPVTRSVWLRELTSKRLEDTADLLRALKGKVLFDKPEEALAASPTKRIMKVRGLGGKDYWARSREEAIFLEQNLNTKNSGSAMGRVVQLANTYIRNPSLVNPLPHVTKNMFFKYGLARVGNFRFKSDTKEYASATPSELKTRFEKVMPMPEKSQRIPQLTARETGDWAGKIATADLKVNNWSSNFIFTKADPAMRFSLWKSYVRKGMGDQEAANHVWLDLVRYDANSGGMNFWKSIPFNFFVPWRTGTYVTLAKQFKAHPIRSLLFVGAVEYLREMRYRSSGRWTHLPVDYIDAPLAEAIENHDPVTTGKLAATTLVFGPGGSATPTTIKDAMSAFQGDPQNKARLMNMFWGLSQLYDMPREYQAYERTGDVKHLVNIVTSAAFSEHSNLKYQPRRLMKWLPEWMPGMEKSELVQRAEYLQGKLKARQEKSQVTYEKRHGVAATWERAPEEQQLEELERGAGVRR